MGGRDRRQGDRRRAGALALTLTLAVACTAPAYAPCPVELSAPLPADAFARCREVLRRDYGKLAIVDAASFRLQTEWAAAADLAGERRASVFLDDAHGDLAVVVELRRVTVPMFGLPEWTEPCGDNAAERALAAALAEALAANAVDVAGSR